LKIVKRSVELINPPTYKDLLEKCETAGRTCYKSDNMISEGSAERLISSLIKSGHHSILEFGNIMFKVVCDRKDLAQLSRHRLFSFAVQSQRYVNYSSNKFNNSVTFIQPNGLTSPQLYIWKESCYRTEKEYMNLLQLKAKPELARSVLNNSVMTEMCMSANVREIRHMIDLRSDIHAQDDIRLISNLLLDKLYNLYPVFFKDLAEKYGRSEGDLINEN
jgi:thymidylate synthase (FAD)